MSKVFAVGALRSRHRPTMVQSAISFELTCDEAVNGTLFNRVFHNFCEQVPTVPGGRDLKQIACQQLEIRRWHDESEIDLSILYGNWY
jgi:hypothetical protein